MIPYSYWRNIYMPSGSSIYKHGSQLFYSILQNLRQVFRKFYLQTWFPTFLIPYCRTIYRSSGSFIYEHGSQLFYSILQNHIYIYSSSGSSIYTHGSQLFYSILQIRTIYIQVFREFSLQTWFSTFKTSYPYWGNIYMSSGSAIYTHGSQL